MWKALWLTGASSSVRAALQPQKPYSYDNPPFRSYLWFKRVAERSIAFYSERHSRRMCERFERGVLLSR
jgi:hypothetical protein